MGGESLNPQRLGAIWHREATAAKDRIDKGDVATACRHWQGLLVQIEKIGSPVSESRVEIEKLMRQHKCEK